MCASVRANVRACVCVFNGAFVRGCVREFCACVCVPISATVLSEVVLTDALVITLPYPFISLISFFLFFYLFVLVGAAPWVSKNLPGFD